MVSWNPWPYQGYIDANNHFLNSLIGGVFIRLFNSDAIWIVRLGNVLSFPIFFWSLVEMSRFFHRWLNSFYLLIALTCSAFVLEFFGLARGYGLSMAFMVLAILQMMLLFKFRKSWRVWGAIMAWLLTVFANLTLLPLALFSMVYIAFFVWKKLNKGLLVLVALAVLALLYLVRYALHLADLGKLYYGGQEGFFNVTVDSFLKPLWFSESIWIVPILVTVSVGLFFSLATYLYHKRDVFSERLLFSKLFFVSIISILAQHYVLGINYPEDRAALFLVIFFFGALSFDLDRFNFKWLTFPLILLSIGLFLASINFNRFVLFEYEHFDEELITSVQDDFSIPPTIGTHRNWAMDNELTRNTAMPGYAFQLAPAVSDTLQDYIIINIERRPDLTAMYSPVYQDDISGLTLFERNKFLLRRKVAEINKSVAGKSKYTDLFNEETNQPYIMRIRGYLENMSIYRSAYVVFSTDDIESDSNIFYQAFPLVQSYPISLSGRLDFDFSMVLPTKPGVQKAKVYFWNRNEEEQKGNITLEIYQIGSYCFLQKKNTENSLNVDGSVIICWFALMINDKLCLSLTSD
jgi:hypothetical protein